MGTPIADMVEQMLSTGIPPESIVIAVRAAEEHAQGLVAVDPVAAKRRAYDRERKRKKAAENSTGNSAESVVRVYKNNNSLGFEDSSQEEEKKKKERDSAEIVEGRRRESRGSRLPADWEPGPTELKFAAGEGLQGDDLRREIMKFRNHWTSKTGRDATKLDWTATWRNWVLNANYRRGTNGTGFGSANHTGARPRSGDALLAGMDRIARRLVGDREDAGWTGDELPLPRPA